MKEHGQQYKIDGAKSILERNMSCLQQATSLILHKISKIASVGFNTQLLANT